jgi:hypothetical protein
MINEFEESALISGNKSAIWNVASDAARWATWDPHVLQCAYEGSLELGAKGWTISRLVSGGRSHFTVVEVTPGRSFTTQSPMPGGKMLIINKYEPAGDSQVQVSRRVEVHGWFAPVFGRVYADRFRRDTRITFGALEREASLVPAENGVPA